MLTRQLQFKHLNTVTPRRSNTSSFEIGNCRWANFPDYDQI